MGGVNWVMTSVRIPISAGHAHPVSAMEQVGTQNATNLVGCSASNATAQKQKRAARMPPVAVHLQHSDAFQRSLLYEVRFGALLRTHFQRRCFVARSRLRAL